VQQFAELGSIPAEYYEKPYYIVPSAGGETAYSLLRETFSRTKSVAVVSLVLYNKAHMGVIQQAGDMLLLLQLRFPAELVPRSDIKTPPLTKPTPLEIEIMTEVVKRYRSPVYMHDYHDEYAERVSELVARKAKGLPEPRQPSPQPNATPASEIVPTLRRALQNGHTFAADAP
jgi:DNA end-binding protein Ku